MKSICVFCASSPGHDPEFLNSARRLGHALAEHQITLVYGGAKIGLMGAVADATLEKGGAVTGVIPRFLSGKEVAHAGLTELILCETMHERKTKMFELSEGFIALPGGFGTLEEVVEILTWKQLGLHQHPVAFLNVNGYYDHLLKFFAEMERGGLLRAEHRQMTFFESDLDRLLQRMR